MIRGRTNGGVAGRLVSVLALLLPLLFASGCTDYRPPSQIDRRTDSLYQAPTVTIGVVWPEGDEFGHAKEGVELAVEEINQEIDLMIEEEIERLLTAQTNDPPMTKEDLRTKRAGYDALNYLAPHRFGERVHSLYKKFSVRNLNYYYVPGEHKASVYDAATSMTSDPTMLAVIGHPHLAGAKQASVIYSQNGVLFFDPLVTSSILSRSGLPFVFRSIYGDEDEARTIQKICTTLGYSKVALLTERQSDSVALSSRIIEQLDRTSIGDSPLGLIRDFAPGDNYYQKTIPELMSQQYDAIIISGTPEASARLVLALRAMNVQSPLIGTNQLDNRHFVTAVGDVAEGTIVNSAHTGMFDMSANEKAFEEKFRTRFGHMPDIAAILSYESVMYIRQAIKRIKSVDTQKLDAALRYQKDFRGSIGGVFSFNKLGEIQGMQVSLRQIKNGRLVNYKLPDSASSPTTEPITKENGQ